ncbi:hypothetical protein [Leptolyngbya sp. FACHB-261]|uniref:hypothetical protein n=1 Tax=Leptolyngbya sp. FACHB-261 TaxID=2692806 RepID=UPI0016828C57|nr:hypothetical protein [Leptolyngbya sp. FACHB-261]MBD2100816.1 hypothetical protein [Leptolyngbya sp. FACHB-261]
MNEQPRARRSNPTKADLEVMLAELKDELEEAHQKEAKLQAQVVELETGLQQHKDLLEQATQMIAQLSEANEAITQEVEALRQGNEELKASQQLAPATPALPKTQPGRFPEGVFGWVD